jgi:hypothetical protein
LCLASAGVNGCGPTAHDVTFDGPAATRRDDKSNVLCQEIVAFPVAELGPASCFGGTEVATETVTASSCSVKVLLFSKVRWAW